MNRVEATHRFGLFDARIYAGQANRCRAKVAVKIGDQIFDAQNGEVSHSQITLRAMRDGAVGRVIDGWTFDA